MEKRFKEERLPATRFTVRSPFVLIVALLANLPAREAASQQPAANNLPQRVHLSSEQDHQRTMELLRITSLRRGVDGDPDSPYAANYDESKANLNPKLPDPLLLRNGQKVTTAKMWWNKRRPEIMEDFAREIYGRVPRAAPPVNWEVTSTAKGVNGDVPVITKKLVGHVENSSNPLIHVDIQLTLSIPANASGPVPVMMELAWSPEAMAAIAKRLPNAFPANGGPTFEQQVFAKGWGYAALIPTTVQADNGEGLTEGVIGLVNKGQPRELDDWGALRAWAWGASRAMDYFEGDKAVDARQVGIGGHSRYGKAALVAMAYDQRFAIAYISSSGEGGAKLYRRNFGEQLENITSTEEYHWMAGSFLKYAGPRTANDLPVDSHELIALCAPRPVFIGAGSARGDGWADPRGMFLAEVGAGPVYRLVGKKDLGSSTFPAIGNSQMDGALGFRQHSGGHTPAPNWPTFLMFAGRYIKGPAVVETNTSAEKLTAQQLTELAKSSSPALAQAISSSFQAKDLMEGTAWSGHGANFFFAIQSTAKPYLFVDGASGPAMENLAGSDLWYAQAHIEPVGKLHSFHYLVNGERRGGRVDLPAFTLASYLQPGIPSGTLSPKITHTSKIYDGMKSEYWIYVPAQYDPTTPAALMVFQDGGGYIDRNGNNPALNVIDNLIAEKKIPVMICVFINPGDISDSPGTPTYNFVKAYSDKWQRSLKDSMRSTLYDTVSDRYVRYLRGEVLAEVAAKYNIRKDAYSRAITGLSSGGICAFNAAWQMPDQFSRVISWIGSFASIQWKEDSEVADGGQDYPEKVLRETKRNLRVWLQDGSEDLETRYGDWSLANLRMANALKFKEYDFHFSFGKGTHNAAHGAAEFPQEMTWLWRDYDPTKTEQTYEMELSEKSKPPFRVSITNREAE